MNMTVKVILPSGVLLEQEALKVVAEAQNGSFGLLPRHVDFVAVLVPGILALTSQDGEETFLAVDEGILVKHGQEVLISTWNALEGKLGELRQAVREQFGELDEREQQARLALEHLGSASHDRFSNGKGVVMPERPDQPPLARPREVSEVVGAREDRKVRTRRTRDRTLWHGLGAAGVVGWSVAVPTVAGVLLGLWLDRNWPSGFSWTLGLLLAGVTLGWLNAWNWVSQESRTMGGEEKQKGNDR